MTSTRLPGKVLLPAGGRSMLAHHLTRLASVDAPIIVATTTNSTDNAVASEALDLGAAVFRGSETDVLGRFAGAAREFELDVIVRVTADCPLIDATVIEQGIRRYREIHDEYAHVSNVLERTYPRGFDFEIFSARALHEANALSRDPVEREHVTPYLYLNRSRHASLHTIRRIEDSSHHRLTLDTPEDLVLLRRLIEQHDAEKLDAEAIISLLDAHPELSAINADIEQKKLGQ
ncbi:cytidylyltransferase domain-containing protein [Microbacterium sp. A196]|uniref:cytidylyltransferase domain-containing protein n=1 Tax=Microbacterium sp. A196 TaxID=3457320 RepID=UPI003FD23703